MVNDNEKVVRANADSALADRISVLDAAINNAGAAAGSVTGALLAPAPKRSFLKDAAKGLAHVAKVIWQVPAARGALATLLVRFGLPGSLVAIGMAVGEKLAQ